MSFESKTLAVAVAFAALAAGPSWASFGEPQQYEEQALGVQLAYGAPMTPLHSGVLEVKATPSYIQGGGGKNTGGSVKGYGGSGGVTYGFNDHFGVGFVVAGNSLGSTRDDITSNDMTSPGPNCGGSSCANLSGTEHGSGFLAGLNAVADPFNGEGFRMPLFAGLSYMSASEYGDDTADGVKNTGSLRSAGTFVGAAFQIPVWKLRVTPFIMDAISFNRPSQSIITYNTANGAQTGEEDFKGSFDKSQVTSVGVILSYQPWGLSFTYLPPVADEGPSMYTLTYAHRFDLAGGSSAN
jgi:hypothetical protein